MSSEIMQETTPLVECSAFHRGMSVLEASLRNTEDSDAIISCLLKGAAEFYGACKTNIFSDRKSKMDSSCGRSSSF